MNLDTHPRQRHHLRLGSQERLPARMPLAVCRTVDYPRGAAVICGACVITFSKAQAY